MLQLSAELRRRCRASRAVRAAAAALYSVLLALVMLSFSTEYASFAAGVSSLKRPLLFFLNWLPIALWMGLFAFALNSVALGGVLAAVPAMALSWVNYYKLALRNDPLLFEDVTLFSEAANMSKRYSFALTGWVVESALLVIAATALLFVLTQGVLPWQKRVVGAGASAAALLAALLLVYPSERLYELTGISGVWAPTQTYTDHGVLYPFLHSIQMDLPPDGYDEAAVAALLADKEEQQIPQERQISVVGIMLEAFSDFTGLAELENDPYADFHALQAQSLSGTLVTNIFAGGTVDTERCFLTGEITGASPRMPSASYVWYFKRQGYVTTGNHPWYNWFYNRENANQYLGFDEYFFSENRFMGADKLPVTDDANLFATIADDVERNARNGLHTFSFNVSYQNHGPYEETYAGAQRYLGAAEGLTSGERAIADNYFSGIADTGAQLAALAERFNAMEEPVALIAFGDHKPWLGDKNSVYLALGISIDVETQAGFFNYYTTPYLIWLNDAAKAVLGTQPVGDGGVRGAYGLLPLLFEQAGWQGDAYMQTIAPLLAQTRFVNCIAYDADGTAAPLGEGETEAVRQIEQLSYWRRGAQPDD